MKLSIIIVTYNSWPEINDCLESIFKHPYQGAFEVIVVDNASSEETLNKVKDKFPRVKVITNDNNLGFAKANNIGAKQSKGELLLFLNPDIIITAGALDKLILEIESNPQAGIVSALLINKDGSPQTNYIRKFPTLFKTILFDTPLKIIATKIPGLKNIYLQKIDLSKERQEIEQPAGACMMIKKSVFDKVNGFDEQFFLFFEDVDLAYRVKRSGLKNYILPKIHLIHKGGSSIKKEKKQKTRQQFFKSAKLYFQKRKK